MEQTVLRPKPMSGPERGGGRPGPARRPHAAPRRGRRLMSLLFALLAGTVLVLSGVGLGTVGATVIGMNRLAEPQERPGAPGAHGRTPALAHAGASRTLGTARGGASLGVEAVDAGKPGALVVGVHVPGPGYTAGLVRGDILLGVGRTRVGSAADLARAVAAVRPGRQVTLTVRHRGGAYQRLTVVPGVVT